MKIKKLTLKEEFYKPEFTVFGISSHAKAYVLCWNINKVLKISFEKVQDQVIGQKMSFSRYNYISETGEQYDLIANRSKYGYLIPDKKSVNYFFVINSQKKAKNKEFMDKLNKNKEVLFIFELDTEKSKYTERFIFND